jgi:hypothetical protein
MRHLQHLALLALGASLSMPNTYELRTPPGYESPKVERRGRQPTQRAFQGGKRRRRCGPRSRKHK